MDLESFVVICVFAALMLGPGAIVLSSTKYSVGARLTWALITLVPTPLALALTALIAGLMGPDGWGHGAFMMYPFLLAVAGPWLVLWIFRKYQVQVMALPSNLSLENRHAEDGAPTQR